MKNILLPLAIVGLIADIITIITFLNIGTSTIPWPGWAIDVDFAYILLIATSALYIAGWFVIYDKIYLWNQGIIAFTGIAYFIPLTVVIYISFRVFGHPKSALLAGIIGPFVELLTPG